MELHLYHIIQEICHKHHLICGLMPGSTDVHATFKISPGGGCPVTGGIGYGSVRGTEVELGIASHNRMHFDLSQPESVDEIDEYLSNYTMWV